MKSGICGGGEREEGREGERGEEREGEGGGREMKMKFLQEKSPPYPNSPDCYTSSAVVSPQVTGRSLHPCLHQADP